jgi:hypothetical protein
MPGGLKYLVLALADSTTAADVESIIPDFDAMAAAISADVVKGVIVTAWTGGQGLLGGLVRLRNRVAIPFFKGLMIGMCPFSPSKFGTKTENVESIIPDFDAMAAAISADAVKGGQVGRGFGEAGQTNK